MEKLYTVEDIATMTNLTTRTIRTYIKDGILKGRKIGGQWRFTEEDIKSFMDNGNYRTDFSNKLRQDILDFIDGVYDFQDEAEKIQICSVIDVYQEEAVVKAKIDKVMKRINAQDGTQIGKYMIVSFDRIESESKTRVSIFAGPHALSEVMKILQE